MSKEKKSKKFNYCVGHYWGEDYGGRIGVYRYFDDVHYGTLKEAQEFLEYVNKQSPEKEWKIFKVEEM